MISTQENYLVEQKNKILFATLVEGYWETYTEPLVARDNLLCSNYLFLDAGGKIV